MRFAFWIKEVSIIPDFTHEEKLITGNCTLIAGIDEVGRGPWAGPVVAAAVIFPADAVTTVYPSTLSHIIPSHARDLETSPRPHLLDGQGRARSDIHWITDVNDSKKLSVKKREALSELIKSTCQWAIGECTNKEIDAIGIGKATRLAMLRALEQLPQTPHHLLIDGREVLDINIPQQSIIDGDALCLSIAAASIIAKVHRDNLMQDYHKEYPNYGFATHVGYGTKQHKQALVEHGHCAIHRASYAPIKKLLAT